MKKSINILAIVGFCGACISFYIGAGFATMQEVVQYEASYGSLFIVAIIVAALIYVYTNLSFATNGNRLNLKRGGDIYGIYCSVFGEKFGNIAAKFFDYFSALFCYMSFVVMCGGANSTVSQQWGLPIGVGAILLTILVISTIVICAGIYTSAVPLLWTGVRKISHEGTKEYKLITIVAGILGCIIACFIPYKGLVNVLYGLNGYLGFILIFFMIVYDIKTKMSSK